MPRQSQPWPHRLARRSLFRIVPAALAVTAALAPATPRAEPPAPWTLRVASIDLAEAPGLAPPKKPTPARPAWRTTFGSERIVVPAAPGKAPAKPAAIDADAVLLQGVTDATVLRRLFPARDWRIVISRELFLSAESAPPVTAVAVRVRPGLRLTAREHLMDLAAEAPPSAPIKAETTSMPSAGSAAPTKTTASSAAAETLPARASATAVRIVEHGRVTWLLSASLPDPCGADDTPCTAQSRLAAWRKEKLAAAETVVAGGKLSGSRAGKHCAEQAIEADLQTLSQSRQDGAPFAGGGCLAVFELHR